MDERAPDGTAGLTVTCGGTERPAYGGTERPAYNERMRHLSFSLTILAGCSIADFDVDQKIPEQSVPGSSIPGPLAALFPLPINLDLESKIKAQDTGPIDSVTLHSIELTITATARPTGDTDDWSFVSHVDVFIESRKSGTTLPKIKVASASMPGPVQTMKFDIEKGVNLKPYVDEGSQVDTTGSGTAPSDDVSYDGNATFTVHPL